MPKSKSDVHVTPDRVFTLIETKWGISRDKLFDPCPVDSKFDGLKIRWMRYNFVNPPYTLLKEFVEKAYDELVFGGNETFLLLPSKTDQEWFHNFILPFQDNIIWIRKRLKFKNNKWSATQPHFIVRFGY